MFQVPTEMDFVKWDPSFIRGELVLVMKLSLKMNRTDSGGPHSPPSLPCCIS